MMSDVWKMFVHEILFNFAHITFHPSLCSVAQMIRILLRGLFLFSAAHMIKRIERFSHITSFMKIHFLFILVAASDYHAKLPANINWMVRENFQQVIHVITTDIYIYSLCCILFLYCNLFFNRSCPSRSKFWKVAIKSSLNAILRVEHANEVRNFNCRFYSQLLNIDILRICWNGNDGFPLK